MNNEPATILIADDNPDIRRLIQVNLKFEGYNTVVAENGVKALQLAQNHRPDLVILDVLMPEMDGWQVLQQLKSNKATRDIPVIMLTGVSMKEGKERGLIEGVEDFLSKPFNPLRLIEIVEDIVATRQITQRGNATSLTQVKVGLIGEGEAGLKMVKALSGTMTIDLVAYCDTNDDPHTHRFVQELGHRFFSDPKLLFDIPDLDLIADIRPDPDEEVRRMAEERNQEYVHGLSALVIRSLLEEQEVSRYKERSLVKELNTRVKELSILNEMAQLLTSPLDLWFLLDKILLLTTRVANVEACAIFMYNEEMEKFTVSHTLGLGEEFKDNARISLSDPIHEEIKAMRRPLVINRIGEWEVSSVINVVQRAGMNSLAAIPLLSKEKLMGIILVLSSGVDSFSKEDVSLLSILAGQAGVAVENAYLYESTKNKSHLVEKLLSKLIQAQEEERKRIAAEIHDTIAQSLVGIHTRIQTCQSLLKKAPEQLEDQLKDLRTVVGDNVKEVRQIIFNLRPSTLDDLGLIPSLENYIKRFEKEHGIFVDFRVNTRERRLQPSMETAIFRIIQEALANVKKHSQGSRVLVRINFEPKWVNLKVADNGKGFSWDEVTDKFLRGDSHGIQGMKERVSVMGGSFKVAAEQGNGCVVTAAIPLTRDTAKLPEISSFDFINR